MLCPHFPQCKGCTSQSSYQEQLYDKRAKLKELFGFDVSIETGTQTYYRNRLDFSFDGTLGFGMDITECILMSPESNALFKIVREKLAEYKISSDFLKFVSIREGKFTKQVMLSFITSTGEHNDFEKVIDEIDAAAKINSICWVVNPDDNSCKGLLFKSFNKEYITERFDKNLFKIMHDTPFPVNSVLGMKIWKDIKGYIPVKSTLASFHAGSGALDAFISEKAGKILSVTNDPVAKQNASANKAVNIEFVSKEDALKIENRADTALLVPPFEGIGKLAGNLKNFKRIIYHSCNPASLVKDISELKEFGISTIRAYDCYPNTPYFELLVVLDWRG